jgi:hypothetical protein
MARFEALPGKATVKKIPKLRFLQTRMLEERA